MLYDNGYGALDIITYEANGGASYLFFFNGLEGLMA